MASWALGPKCPGSDCPGPNLPRTCGNRTSCRQIGPGQLNSIVRGPTCLEPEDGDGGGSGGSGCGGGGNGGGVGGEK